MTIRSSRRTFVKQAGLLIASAHAAPWVGLAAAADTPVIGTTSAGKVRGTVVDGINVFKGIPYGDDTAKRRFMAAVPAKPWTGIRDTLTWGPQAPKPAAIPRQIGDSKAPSKAPPLFPPAPPNVMSEDCLNLSVWTPGLQDGGKRPVMVWFHGGGYAAGSGNSPGSDGVRLCKRGNVVVAGWCMEFGHVVIF